MSTDGCTKQFLDGLKSRELLLRLTWDEWLAIEPPYADRKLGTADAWIRYQRNGYDWDMHGTLLYAGKRDGSSPSFCFLSWRRGQ
jgi:hypothetical protein